MPKREKASYESKAAKYAMLKARKTILLPFEREEEKARYERTRTTPRKVVE